VEITTWGFEFRDRQGEISGRKYTQNKGMGQVEGKKMGC